MAKAKVQPKPLEQLGAALPTVTNDELLAFAVEILEEAARRADNYADLIGEDIPQDTLNEGQVFVTRAGDLFDSRIADHGRAKEAKRRLRHATWDLNAAWGPVVTAAEKSEIES